MESYLITPDRYALIHYITEDLYAILSGWSGGYLHGDSWRRSSPISSVEAVDDGYMVKTGSSVYLLRHKANGLTGMSGSVWASIAEHPENRGNVTLHTDEDEIENILAGFYNTAASP